MGRHAALLRRADTIVVAIDLQDVFLRVMYEPDRLLSNARLLLQAAAIMGVRAVATTQNSARLGGLSEKIAEVLPRAGDPIDKLVFSAASLPDVVQALQKAGCSQVVLCGVETHICVTQTALDLVALGYQVHVVADAVSSRSLEKHKLGMERIRDNGALPIATEAAVYELLGEAGTPEFRQILPLLK